MMIDILYAFIFFLIFAIVFLSIKFRSHFFLLPAWFFPHKKGRVFFHKLRGVRIGKNVEIGYLVMIDNLYPSKVSIGDNTTITYGVTILAHDNAKYYTGKSSKPTVVNTIIGNNCFLGINSIILPGIKVNDGAIVGSGSIVTKNVPSNKVFVGNPAVEVSKRD